METRRRLVGVDDGQILGEDRVQRLGEESVVVGDQDAHHSPT